MTKFADLLSSLTTSFTPIVNTGYKQKDYGLIDLSVKQHIQLQDQPVANTQTFIDQFLARHHKKVAFGGYLEQRNLYQQSTHFTSASRDIHIGLDIWCPTKTQVVSPLNGRVFAIKNNDSLGNYGPTIILEHQEQSQLFYTLYGHLSEDSLNQYSVYQEVKKGDVFAKIGSPEVNGNYAPHLHFQLIKELDGFVGDYPGVAAQSDIDYYKKNCPDPNLLLKIL